MAPVGKVIAAADARPSVLSSPMASSYEAPVAQIDASLGQIAPNYSPGAQQFSSSKAPHTQSGQVSCHDFDNWVIGGLDREAQPPARHYRSSHSPDVQLDVVGAAGTALTRTNCLGG